ncbi:MAG: hypothetical protein A2W22_00430 [Candidatus Levybacteria bacterium RBG_16_35_11]|nr:MAG: hypothetical protein A2W22_00430 [Candidatus Levybacteria bacterium RBG_16_35_11]
MATEGERNLEALSSQESEARKIAYRHLEEEGLNRINNDHMYVDEEILDVGLFARRLSFVSPVKLSMVSTVTVGETEDEERLRAIDIRLGTLLGGNKLYDVHYVYKNGNLLKRIAKGINMFEGETESFRTGFENVEAQEAEGLADFIKDPSIDNLRNYIQNIKSKEPHRPLPTIGRIISLKERIAVSNR